MNGSVKLYLLLEKGIVLKWRVIVAPLSKSPNLYLPVVVLQSVLKNFARGVLYSGKYGFSLP
jgi:hypothetical protein